MTTFLPREVQDGLDAARRASLRKASRLRVQVGEEIYPVLSLWRDGFAVEEDRVPPLRGLVDLFDGAHHLYQCLIVASEEDRGEMRYEFKRSTRAEDRAPLDFAWSEDAPAGLITQEKR